MKKFGLEKNKKIGFNQKMNNRKMKSLWKKSKKWAIFFGVIAIFYAAFTLNTSVSKIAIKEVKQSANKEQVQKIWDKYIGEISSKNGQEKLIKATKDKLAKMDLSDEEITQWHTQFRAFSDGKPSINIIVIPDLSYRIIEIPYTEKYDKELIAEVYRLFFQKAKKYQSADKLVVEVTDNNQASGLFGQIAENLTIDMTDKQNNETSKKYLQGKEQSFMQNIDILYQEAIRKVQGADYVYYFNRIAPSRVKKSDIYTEYINKIIILTDGYLEAQRRIYTVITPFNNLLKPAVVKGNLKEVMIQKGLFIPQCRNILPNTEILVLEITERPNGIMWHKEVLAQYWKDWFMKMGVKNVYENNDDFFQLHNHNMNETKKIIKNFLN